MGTEFIKPQKKFSFAANSALPSAKNSGSPSDDEDDDSDSDSEESDSDKTVTYQLVRISQSILCYLFIS